jgi:hypothetical protein
MNAGHIMVKICPSELCKHENPDKNNYCEKCGIDLSQDRMEVQGRDDLFRLFKSTEPPKTFTEEEKKMFESLSRRDFDLAIEKHVGKIYMLLINAFVGKMREDDKPKGRKEQEAIDIEMEKLKVLREISNNLKKLNSKKTRH